MLYTSVLISCKCFCLLIQHQGTGVLRMINGDVYEGLWDKNMRNKKGRAIYANGDVYEGIWMNNLVIERCNNS